MEGAVSRLCCRSGLETSCNLKAADDTAFCQHSSLSEGVSEMLFYWEKGKYSCTSIKHFTPGASSSYLAVRTSFVSRAISELGQSNTMRGKYTS